MISVRGLGVVGVGSRGTECSDALDRGSRLGNSVQMPAVDLGLCSLGLPGRPPGCYLLTPFTLSGRLIAFERRLAPGDRRIRPGDSFRGGLSNVGDLKAKGLKQVGQRCLALIGGRLSVVGDLVPLVGGSFSVVGDLVPLVGDPLSVVGGLVSVVGGPLAFMGYSPYLVMASTVRARFAGLHLSRLQPEDGRCRALLVAGLCFLLLCAACLMMPNPGQARRVQNMCERVA